MKSMIKKIQKRNNKKGFTLVEIIVVLVIMAILAAIAVPAVMGYIDDANEATYVQEARSIYLVVQTESAKAKVDDTISWPGIKESAQDKTGLKNITITVGTVDDDGEFTADESGITPHTVDNDSSYQIDFTSSDGSSVIAIVTPNKEVTVEVGE